MSNRVKDLSADGAKESAARSRHKEGGTWTFLTWAFFISQLIGSEQFVGAAAAASPDESAQSPNAPMLDSSVLSPGLASLMGTAGTTAEESQSQPIADDPPEGRGSVAQASGVQSHFARADNASSNPRFAADVADGGDIGLFSHISWSDEYLPASANLIDGAVQPITQTAHSLAEMLTDAIDIVLHPLPPVIGELAEAIADTAFSATSDLDTLVTDGATTVLSNVDGLANSVGQNVENVVDQLLPGGGQVPVLTSALSAVANTLGTPAEGPHPSLGVELIGYRLDNNDAQTVDKVVASSGEIVFRQSQPADSGANDLFSGGLYTDYHLAFRAALQPSGFESGAIAAPSSSDLLDHSLPIPDHGSTTSNDESLLISQPIILDDMAHRSLGDGISH